MRHTINLHFVAVALLLLLQACFTLADANYPVFDLSSPRKRGNSYGGGGTDNATSGPCGGRNDLPNNSTYRFNWPLYDMAPQISRYFKNDANDQRNITIVQSMFLGVVAENGTGSDGSGYNWATIQSPNATITGPQTSFTYYYCEYPGINATSLLDPFFDGNVTSYMQKNRNRLNATIRLVVDVWDEDNFVEKRSQCSDITLLPGDGFLPKNRQCYYGKAATTVIMSPSNYPTIANYYPSKSSNSDFGNPQTNIVGIIVGVIVGVVVFFLAIICCCKSARKADAATNATLIRNRNRPNMVGVYRPADATVMRDEQLPSYAEAVKDRRRVDQPPPPPSSLQPPPSAHNRPEAMNPGDNAVPLRGLVAQIGAEEAPPYSPVRERRMEQNV